ncbi:MAG: Ig-like domain-containing protein [Rubrivivax sp.]|nr:Ig-like domain-containing protein [Rubrivivax sp.]
MSHSPTTTSHRPFAALARGCLLALIAAAGLGTLVGSGGGGGSSTPAALTVISTSPTNGATGVAVATTVSATFSENLANTPSLTLTGTGGGVAGTVTRAGATVTFTPSAALAFSTTYTATVSGGSGASGGAQSGSTAFSFTTQADPASPPAITLSSTALTFTAAPGGANPLAQVVNISNSGGGTLGGLAVGAITYGAGATGWLQAPVLNSTTAPATLTVQPVTGALAAGTYTATIPITSGVASNSPRTVTVTFNVTAATGITISGTADFQSVPNDTTTNGRLVYANTTVRPIRGATVEVLPAAGGAALATGTTSATGTYSLSIATAQSVIVRVRAEMKKTAGAGGTWDFTVRDNTAGNALYVLDTAPFTPVAGANTKDLRANSGWGGASYTGIRAAGPFAVLDVVYDATQKVLGASPNAVFPPLQLMWSVNNRPASGDRTQGFIGTSFYTIEGGTHRIYILGFADDDTDEYDRPVVAHEYGHYFQSAFSRDDSLGGSHSGSDRLDMRVAFSEGWGNAWSGMALNSQYYADSFNVGQQGGFRIDLAASPTTNQGFFSERSVQYLMYTWHANPSIGFAPLFTVLANLRTTLLAEATLSSIHHFAHYLKLQVPGQAAAIDALLATQQITVADARGSTETNGGAIAEALPVYRTHTAAIGAAQNYCVTDAARPLPAGSGDEDNKLGANVFIRFTLAAGGARVITATATTAGATSDPALAVFTNAGAISDFDSSGTGTETANITLAAGTHIIELYDFALTVGNNASLNNGQRCFNITVQ